MKRALLISLLILELTGCAAPINPALWNPRPTVVAVLEDLEFDQEKVGKLFVPRGEYTYWYSNKFGYYYGNDSAQLRLVHQTVFRGQKEEVFKGGLWLSNRIDAVIVYGLSSIADNAKVGEVAHLAAWEAGDNDGLVRDWKGQVPQALRSKLEFR